jgi:hypothetical protein
MALTGTREELESLDYSYSGESLCRGCGALIVWFDTINGKKMPMSVVKGTEDNERRVLEPHFATCPKAASFRKVKKK